jgi:hypothetical protein
MVKNRNDKFTWGPGDLVIENRKPGRPKGSKNRNAQKRDFIGKRNDPASWF